MLSEVFSNVGASIPLDTHIIVSLILHKIADDKEEIRTAAQSMLNVLLRKQARFEQDATEKLLDIQVRLNTNCRMPTRLAYACSHPVRYFLSYRIPRISLSVD